MIATNYHNIKRRILVPVILSIIAITGVAVAGAYWQKNTGFSEKADAQVHHIHQMFESRIENDGQLLNSLLDSIEENRALQKAWLKKDKDALLSHSQPLLHQLRSRYRVTHLYFIDLDKVCFLRTHKPEHSGDLITRFTLQQASATSMPAQGIELGKYGAFTLRVVRPWYIDDVLTGYIELGEEISHLIEKQESNNDTQTIISIDKKFLNRKNWEAGQIMLGLHSTWDKFSNFTVDHIQDHDHNINLVAHQNNHNLKEKIKITPTLEAKLNTLFGEDIFDHITYQDYQIHAIPLIDAGNRKVGKILAIHSHSEAQRELSAYLAVLIFCAVIITILLSFFFYRYASGIEAELRKDN